ncbi:MAG: hypothetical protein ACTSWY_09965 [Promethearchaeota archaeon]
MVRKILEEKKISIPEVKKILENLEAKIGIENFDTFQESTLQYAKMFSKVTDLKKVEKIKKMLMSDYNLDESYAIMIINILPNTVEELSVIFEKDLKLSKLSNDDLQEMIYKIKDFL